MIDIVVGPNLVSLGSFVMSWHGFFSFIAVASAVYLVGRWSLISGIDQDDMYSLAIWAILGGILGARAVQPPGDGLSHNRVGVAENEGAKSQHVVY